MFRWLLQKKTKNIRCTMKMRQENTCTCTNKITKCELSLLLKREGTLIQTTFKSVNFRCLIDLTVI
jgi:hypothetical protein